MYIPLGNYNSCYDFKDPLTVPKYSTGLAHDGLINLQIPSPADRLFFFFFPVVKVQRLPELDGKTP